MNLSLNPGGWGQRRYGVATDTNYELPLSALTDTRASSATYLNTTTGLITSVGNNVKRINSSGLLIEPSGTNLLLYSQTFSNAAWFPNGVTVTASSIAAPDGTMTAFEMTSTTVGTGLIQGEPFSGPTFTGATGVVYTFSIWVATTSGTQSGNITFYDNIAATTYGSMDFIATTTWQRISTSYAIPNGDTFIISVRTNVLNNVFQIWGAQLEAGTIMTSYIPTTAAAVTRAGDVVTGFDAWWPGGAYGGIANTGSLSMNVTLLPGYDVSGALNTTPTLICNAPTQTTGQILCYLYAISAPPSYITVNTDDNEVAYTLSLSNALATKTNIGISWDSSHVTLYVNGVAGTPETYNTLSTASGSQLGGGGNSSFSQNMACYVNNIVFSTTSDGAIP